MRKLLMLVVAMGTLVGQAGEDGNFSVFAHFIRKIAKERNISLAESASMLYDLGIRGYDCGPYEKDLDQLYATKLKPINFYYFAPFFGADGGAEANGFCLSQAAKYKIPRIMTIPPAFTGKRDQEEEFADILKSMKSFVAQAKEKGITVTVEDFGGTNNACSHAKYLKRMLDEIPDLRFALDSGNLYYAGRGEDILEMMKYAGKRIAHVHLKDQTPEDGRKYASLGLGAVPNRQLVKSVVSSGYDGWYTLENPVGDTYIDTIRQMSVLKAWMAEAKPAKRDVVIYVSCHPDDLAGSIGTVIRLKERFDVHVIEFTHGELGLGRAGLLDGSTAKIRTAEDEAVCKAIGVPLHWCNAIDGSAYADQTECDRIAGYYRELKPRAIITHSLIETHNDHMMSAAAAIKAAQLAGIKPEMYFQEQDIQSRSFQPVYWVDVSALTKRRRELISMWACQHGPDIAERKIRTSMTNALRLPRGRFSHAEVFGVFPGTVPPGKGIFDELPGVMR